MSNNIDSEGFETVAPRLGPQLSFRKGLDQKKPEAEGMGVKPQVGISPRRFTNESCG